MPKECRLEDFYREDEVARTYIINHIQPLNNLTKTGMNTVKVLSISTVMTDEEL
jgi:hypothetical protein